jgi:hypothetical protein
MRHIALLLGLFIVASASAATLVHLGKDGKLVYEPYDSQGDTIPDFSNCGYMGGGVRIPDVPVKATIEPMVGSSDDTDRIQNAINEVAAMPLDSDGFRGAVLLKRGQYHIASSLKIHASGIVLRGEGNGENDTVLTATGSTVRAMIDIRGESRATLERGQSQPVTDSYVPVGAHSMNVADGSIFHVGDTVIVRRVGNAAWIHEIKMDQIVQKQDTKEWEPFVIDHDRVITAVEGNRITIDAPIVCAIDKQWGGGAVFKTSDAGRIEQIGVENLRAISSFDPSVKSTVGIKSPYMADEQHASDAISFEDCKNGWARQIVTLHFWHSAEMMLHNAKWITVEDCQALEPVSIITGGRRYPFNIEGQLDLVLRCYSKDQRHAFVNNGSHSPGPCAFVQCTSENDYADSGPHQRWSSGTLWDNVHGVMHTQDRQDMGTGHGWAGANDVYWNCSGEITIQQPPTAQNFAIGFVGEKQPPAFAQLHHPDGYYESFGHHVQPASLYLQQLKDRLGSQAVNNIAANGN